MSSIDDDKENENKRRKVQFLRENQRYLQERSLKEKQDALNIKGNKPNDPTKPNDTGPHAPLIPCPLCKQTHKKGATCKPR